VFKVIPADIKIYVSQALQVTTLIKKLLDNPIAVIITEIIPGDWDNKIKEAVIHALDQSLPYLLIVDRCKEHKDLPLMIACWIGELRTLPKPVQDALLVKLASLIAAYLDKKELRTSHYDLYTQLLYSGTKEGKAE
jgi:hypothetical protein